MPFDVPGFVDADAHDPQGLILYLDLCARTAAVQKRESYAALGIAAGMSVLDIGCGTGDDVRAIAQIVGASGRVVGVDSSRVLLAEASRRGLPANAEALCASAEALPLADASVDLCRADRVFQHLRRPARAAAEIRRVLKPGGRALVNDQDWPSLTIGGGDAALSERVVAAFVASLANGAVGSRLGMLLAEAGLQAVQVRSIRTEAPFAPAYALVLASAAACACTSGAIARAEADAWIASLLEADRRGTFFYSVNMMVAQGCAPQGSANPSP